MFGRAERQNERKNEKTKKTADIAGALLYDDIVFLSGKSGGGCLQHV